jgi:hypothetical protein
MFDFELFRRLNQAAPMTETDVDDARRAREVDDTVTLESSNSKHPRLPVPPLSDADVASLISVEARDAVIAFEVSSQEVYNKKYIHPEAPAGQSGITVGIGYDLGYNSPSDVRAHWHELLPSDQIERMVAACGLKGPQARERLAEFRDITVPWEAAIEVYRRSIMPRFGRMVLASFPNAMEVKGHAFGALFSLVYNRGSSLDGDSRREMR